MAEEMNRTPTDERELDAEASRIVYEALPAWWNSYTHKYPTSKAPESTKRRLLAHYVAKATLQHCRSQKSPSYDFDQATIRALREALEISRSHLKLFCGPDDAIANEVFAIADVALTLAEK